MRFLKFLTLALAASVSLTLTQTATAWNATGHETVALIAYDQLSPAEQTTLAQILEHHPRRDKDVLMNLQPGDDRATELFITAATWPDVVRSPVNPLMRTENHPQWHYVDFPFDEDGAKGPEPELLWDGKTDPKNLLEALQKVEPEFSDPHTAASRRAIDLCWIEHLVGDIHQPLHSISLYSNAFPDGDKGGNLIAFREADDRSGALHWYWDSLEGTALNLKDIRAIASRVEQEHPEMSLQQEMTKMAVRQWADESNVLARTVTYNNGQIPGIPRQQASEDANQGNFAAIPKLSDAYQAKAHEVADLRVALAGYRLAATLKTLLVQMQQAAATQPSASTMPMTP